MKFFLGFLTSSIIALLLVIGCWFYFDLPIDTNDETSPQVKQVEEVHQTEPSQAPVSENNVDNTEITPSGLTVEEYNKLPHNNAGTNNYDYAVKNGLTQEDN